jgi:hypothetical protein
MAEPIITPIPPELLAAALTHKANLANATPAVRRALAANAPGAPDPDAQDWFGPGAPSPPLAPAGVKGRGWDYPVGYNLRVQPRGDEAIGFPQLRGLAQSWDMLRLVIETRKDQLNRLKWTVKPQAGASGAAARQVAEAGQLLKIPDRIHPFPIWLRMLLEDMFVGDCATIYPRLTRGGALYALEPVDGATIRPIIDESGRVPAPPAPAYSQVLKGLAAVDYTRDELIYCPRNPLTWRVYGLSQVEQIILLVNIALRREMYLLEYYTAGNVPDALMEVPASWQPNQIREFQEYWDALHEGNLGQRRKMKMVPGGCVPHWTKDPVLKDELDEWLARVVCYCFSVSPQPLVKQMNRATADTAQEQALAEGLRPLMYWVRDLLNLCLWKYGFDQVEFAWLEETSIDPKVQAEIDDLNIKNGSKSVDEVRAERGLAPLGMGNAVYTAQGPVLLADIIKAA